MAEVLGRGEVASLEDYPWIFSIRAAIQRTPRRPVTFVGQELLLSYEREERTEEVGAGVQDAKSLRPVGLIGTGVRARS